MKITAELRKAIEESKMLLEAEDSDTMSILESITDEDLVIINEA